MQTYIALLRGINVSGHKKIKMAHLRQLMTKMGFIDVQTYIQSGNLVFKYADANPEIIAAKIKKGIKNEYGFDVEVLVLESNNFKKIADQNPYSINEDADRKLIYYIFLFDLPDLDATEKLSSQEFDGEEFSITNECIFLYCFGGYGKAKCNNNFFEKRLGIRATARNYNTVNKLLELTR